jgi:ATP synthase protein I
MSDPRETPEPSPEARRLQSLTKRLDKAKAEGAASALWRDRSRPPPGTAVGLALRIGVELVSALAVGGGIGWLLDRWLGSRPWLMVTCFLAGGIAGMLNVYRVVRRLGYSAGYRKDDSGDAGGGR